MDGPKENEKKVLAEEAENMKERTECVMEETNEEGKIRQTQGIPGKNGEVLLLLLLIPLLLPLTAATVPLNGCHGGYDDLCTRSWNMTMKSDVSTVCMDSTVEGNASCKPTVTRGSDVE